MKEQHTEDAHTIEHKKPWLIWLSFFSWFVLLPWGFITILFVEKRGIIAWCGFAARFFLWVMAVLIPIGLASAAINLLPYAAAQIGNIVVLICLYFAGVYAANKIYFLLKQ